MFLGYTKKTQPLPHNLLAENHEHQVIMWYQIQKYEDGLPTRSVGGQLTRSKDSLKESLHASASMPTGKHVPRIDPRGAACYKPEPERLGENRIAEAHTNVLHAKEGLHSSTDTSVCPTYTCSECGRVLQAHIELISHLAPIGPCHNRRS